VRKEDKRFITGKGRYVDDVKLVGMSYAHFVRSPHAHAKVKSIDSSAAMKMPGVIAVLTGSELVADKIGNLICGWAITSKDGTPMKMGAWPAMAPETVRFVGQAVAVVIAESKNQARDAAESVAVDYEELPVVADIRPQLPRALRSFTRRRRATSSMTGISATRGRRRLLSSLRRMS
jgi:carbon-monoxide dehydrogenase large subunit